MREVDDIEQQLQSSLRRIDPNPRFVDHLHTRLTRPVDMEIEQRRTYLMLAYLTVAAALFSGALAIWLWQFLRGRQSTQAL